MKRHKFDFVDFLILLVLGIAAIICVFPFYQTIVLSISSITDIATKKVLLFPSSINLSAYQYLVEEGKMIRGLIVTVFVTIAGTLLSLAVTTAGAYGLTKKELPGYAFILNAIILTMFFGGGLVPFFLTVRSLGLLNNVLVMIIPSAINTFNFILMKNYFSSIPAELEDSAYVDGANELIILIRIIAPVSAPIMATIALFYSVAYWNTWYNAMIFITDTRLYPLQLILREMVINISNIMNDQLYDKMMEAKTFYPESVRAAIIVVSAFPILMVYPFLQKYFAKGIMLGSIKG
jgi:putative aldouronate transport system permease protein